MGSFGGYVSLVRPNVCLLAIFGVVVGYLLSPGSGFPAAYDVKLLLAVAVAFLACGAGNVINDYFDYKIDKTNAPNRPIPSGAVKRKNALALYFSLSISSLALAFSVSMYFFWIALANVAVLSAYGWNLKRSIYMKNSAVSWLSSSSFLAGGFILNTSIAPAVLIVFMVSFLGTFSREVFKDVQDLKGDRRQKVRTFATVFGRPAATNIASMVAVTALLSVVSPYLFGVYPIAYVLAASPCILLGALAVSNRKDAKKSQRLLKASMYCFTVALILTVIMGVV